MDVSNAKDIAEKALEYLQNLVPKAKYAALEGIEFDEAQNEWEVIVGYSQEWDIPFNATLAGVGSNKRTYKKMYIDPNTWNLKSMMPYEPTPNYRS